MDTPSLRKLLQDVREGAITPDDAVARLRHMPFEDLGFAKIDHHRRVRSGMPEVIFSQGKTPAQVAKIFKQMVVQGGNVLATKATAEHFRAVKKLVHKAEYRELAKAITLQQDPATYGKGSVVIISAG
ncbi:MAG TPA: 1-(5-phosphoribosyl)-5-amino-4-imidazole-carboxylate carboxylase, partial [Candidatus Angelobacter sp.]|nr:1-(5-phosphoribosyl)-5-amino-4-imidazole-carboxylate carboxylase [Candidatus Angelobacter sp.]